MLYFKNVLHPRVIAYLQQLRSCIKMTRLDNRTIPNNSSEIRAFVCMRNEALRLPYFIEYYASKGVSRFFFIDNGSTDGSVNIVLRYQNTHVFSTKESYKRCMNWIDILLRRYSLNQWALVVDVDEIFISPLLDKSSIAQTCAHLELLGAHGLRCVLLDMYSDLQLSKINYQQGEDPLKYCPYFDSNYRSVTATAINRRKLKEYQSKVFIGGMRERIFGSDNWISKIPLFFNTKNTSISLGAHTISECQLATCQGALLHFKFFSDFLERVPDEVLRAEHCNSAGEYKKYLLSLDPALIFFDSNSQRYSEPKSLIDAGVMIA